MIHSRVWRVHRDVRLVVVVVIVVVLRRTRVWCRWRGRGRGWCGGGWGMCGAFCLLFGGLGLFFLVQFLHLHSPVLEPDLDLALGKVEGLREFGTAVPRQIHVRLELLLQFVDLQLGVRSSFGPARRGRERGQETTRRCSSCIWKRKAKCTTY